MYCRISELGLREDYNNDTDVGKWLKLFFGLPFVPLQQIEDAYVELISQMPENSAAAEFSDYILSNYIENECKFPPRLWFDDYSTNPKTTNGAESFHKHFKQSSYSSKPSVHLVVSLLLDVQLETVLKIQGFKNTKVTVLDDKYKLQICMQMQKTTIPMKLSLFWKKFV